MNDCSQAPILWKGISTGFSPDPVTLDDLIGQRIRARGFKGSRARGQCTFASTDRNQAESYANTPDELRSVTPKLGGIVSWAHGVGDLILDLEIFLKDVYWGDREIHWSLRSVQPLLDDVRGDVSLLDFYLSQGRQKRAITAIIDKYIDSLDLREMEISDDSDLSDVLTGHDGEVWITGACELHGTA